MKSPVPATVEEVGKQTPIPPGLLKHLGGLVKLADQQVGVRGYIRHDDSGFTFVNPYQQRRQKAGLPIPAVPDTVDQLLESLPVQDMPSLPNEARSEEYGTREFPNPHIAVGPKFHALPKDMQEHVLLHEAAHFYGLDDEYLNSPGSDWNLAEKTVYGALNGQTTPGEIIAEAYAVRAQEGRAELERMAPGLSDIIERLAKEAGLPIPEEKADKAKSFQQVRRESAAAVDRAPDIPADDKTAARLLTATIQRRAQAEYADLLNAGIEKVKSYTEGPWSPIRSRADEVLAYRQAKYEPGVGYVPAITKNTADGLKLALDDKGAKISLGRRAAAGFRQAGVAEVSPQERERIQAGADALYTNPATASLAAELRPTVFAATKNFDLGKLAGEALIDTPQAEYTRSVIVAYDTAARGWASPDEPDRPHVTEPGQSTSDGGWAGTLRHEFGHMVQDRVVEPRFPDLAKRIDDVFRQADKGGPVEGWSKNGLSSYAGKNSKEAFAEAFGIVTDPAYDRELWRGAQGEEMLDVVQEVLDRLKAEAQGASQKATEAAAQPKPAALPKPANADAFDSEPSDVLKGLAGAWDEWKQKGVFRMSSAEIAALGDPRLRVVDPQGSIQIGGAGGYADQIAASWQRDHINIGGPAWDRAAPDTREFLLAHETSHAASADILANDPKKDELLAPFRNTPTGYTFSERNLYLPGPDEFARGPEEMMADIGATILIYGRDVLQYQFEQEKLHDIGAEPADPRLQRLYDTIVAALDRVGNPPKLRADLPPRETGS